MIKSELLEIKGIGKTKAAALIKHFGSMKKLKNADLDALCEVRGITRQLAQNIIEYFK